MKTYAEYDYYVSLYGEESMTENMFKIFSYDACRKIDHITTGVDNVKKLKVAFPTDEDDIEAIKRCTCKIINIMHSIQEAEKRINSSKGYTKREDGTLQGKIVSSVTSGNESISYSVNGNSSEATMIDKVLTDRQAQEKLYRDTVLEYLSGTGDANGVNLLYMGPYPYRTE